MKEGHKRARSNLPEAAIGLESAGCIAALKPGEDYNNLKPGYIIFICTFDPFGKGLYKYTFENRCLETDMALGDKTTKIFFNTKGINPEEVSEEMLAFLAYVEENTDSCALKTQSETIHRIHNRIKELKKNREMGAKFMLLEELIKNAEKKAGAKGRLEGISKGRSEEQNRYSRLILQLTKDGRSDLIVKAASDTHLLNALYQEYKL